MQKIVKKGIQLLEPVPEAAGVYLFKNNIGKVIYVGKAKNLKNRVASYFSNQLGLKTSQMVDAAKSVSFIKVVSEFEALLLEANLVKKYKPRYNIQLKDDKSPLYIGITKDRYPRIILFRKPEMKNLLLTTYYGPFLSGKVARKILRMIRHIFPFSTHLPTQRICIYRQIGLCKPCPSEIENETDLTKKIQLKRKYLRNLKNVKQILNGKLGIVGVNLERQIKDYAKKEMFEEAGEVSDQLKIFKDIANREDYDIGQYLENPNLVSDIRDKETNELKKILSKYLRIDKLKRIECFDIAHLAGSFPTASMVTFIDGEPEKKYYRHFKIYNKKRKSDVDSMREVIARRVKHLKDWGRPDLIIIDGGKPQLTSVNDILEAEKIPFIGLAKRLETIVVKTDLGFSEIRPYGEALHLIQRIRDEAHRFAQRLHHNLLKKSMLQA